MNLLKKCVPTAETSHFDFAPPLLRLQSAPPHPLGPQVLRVLLALLLGLLLWTLFGKLDIVAVAQGRLVPQSYLKIVQPSEAGMVREILVHEGQSVAAGQVLMRMDTRITDADARALNAQYARKRLTLRRIDAELSASPFRVESADTPALAEEVAAQYRANRAALEAAVAEEQSRLLRAREDLLAAEQIRAKLGHVLPYYLAQEQAFDKLAQEGFAGPLMLSDKRRERIEKEQELKTQTHVIESARTGIMQSDKKLLQIHSDYRRLLHAERNEAGQALDQLTQEIAKHTRRKELQELRAPQAAIVKDLATHTEGTVVQPGSVLLTLVPQGEPLRAEVWVANEDIGFVQPGRAVKLKFAAFPFQKYGMIEGTVEHVGADAAENTSLAGGAHPDPTASPLAPAYKALIALKKMSLDAGGQRLPLAAGMQVHAEVWLGTRTVAQYLLSPIQKAWHESGREP